MSLTITQVAKVAKVGRATASDILNRGEAARYSADTVKRVQIVAKDLGYQPNYLASSLRSGKRMCIGVATGANLSRAYDPFSALISEGIGEVADLKQYNIMQFPITAFKMHERLTAASRGKMVDGLIFMVYSQHRERVLHNTIPILKEEKIPFVALYYSGTKPDFHQVDVNYYEAGKLATRHMLEQGYTDIMLVDLKKVYRDEFYQAYCHTMDEAGLKKRPCRIDTNVTNAQEALTTAEEIIKTHGRANAYIAYNDIMAFGIIEALNQQGISVPEQAGVMGCGHYLNDFILYSKLSTIDLKMRARGKMAAEILFDEIENGQGEKYQQVLIEPELIVRESSMKK